MPTPTFCVQPRRFSDFSTVGEALDYAAAGTRGLNFHDPRGNLARVYPFSELRSDALVMARRLIAHGVRKDDRVALIAETGPEFAALFCGCVYAGAWPVPLPLPTSFGGKESYIDQLTVQLQSSDPSILFYPAEIAEMTGKAAARQGCEGIVWEDFAQTEAPALDLPAATLPPWADRCWSRLAWVAPGMWASANCCEPRAGFIRSKLQSNTMWG